VETPIRRRHERSVSMPCTRLSAPITARTAPDTSHSAIRKPAVIQKACREVSALRIASSMNEKAAPDTLSFAFGASSSLQTSSRCRKPSRPNPNSRNGTIEERIWKEIALA
jgi:hypothetical protein